jgi:hypothetical protein
MRGVVWENLSAKPLYCVNIIWVEFVRVNLSENDPSPKEVEGRN